MYEVGPGVKRPAINTAAHATCTNTQCRVKTYQAHGPKAPDRRCPACYGQPITGLAADRE